MGTAIDMHDFAGHEFSLIEIEHSVNDLGNRGVGDVAGNAEDILIRTGFQIARTGDDLVTLRAKPLNQRDTDALRGAGNDDDYLCHDLDPLSCVVGCTST